MKITPARRQFKSLAGNVNQFLITILVGLDAVREGRGELNPSFSTTWEPKDPAASADRSSEFAIRALITWLVDALDSYPRALNRRPFQIQDPEVRRDLDAVGNSVQMRVDLLARLTNTDSTPSYALSVVAIVWRNRLVHYGAENEVPDRVVEILEQSAEAIAANHRDLDVTRMLSDLQTTRTPAFKVATSLVFAAHNFVAEADRSILDRLDLDQYLDESLGVYVAVNPEARSANIWGKAEDRRLKTIRQMAMEAGLGPGTKAPLLEDKRIEEIAKFGLTEARAKYAPRSS